MILTQAYANRTIKKSDKGYHPKKLRYNTDDIIKLVLWADKRVKDDLREFAKAIPPTKAGMQMLFDFIVRQIKYRKDPPKSQWVRSPARTWHDRRKGSDCKSWTLFITSVLQNLGLDYIIRFVSYRKRNKTPKHVYPIAVLPTGEQIAMDAVYRVQKGGRFNTEKHFYHKTDYKVKAGLAYLTGTDTEDFAEVLLQLDRDIPDSFLNNDLTRKTEGEVQRYLMAQRLDIAAVQLRDTRSQDRMRYAAQVIRTADLAGLGSVDDEMRRPVLDFIRQTDRMNRPAFNAPTFRLKSAEEIAGLGDFFKKVGKAIGKGAKAIGKGVVKVATAPIKVVTGFLKKVWAKIMNWIFKSGLVKAGPFFLFTFIKKKLGGEVDRRKLEQNKTLRWLQKLGMKRSNIDAAIKNGIVEKMGATPERILNNQAKAGIAGDIGAASAILGALGWVIKVVEKVASFFKKDNPPQPTEAEASDVELIQPTNQPIAKEAGMGSGGMGIMIAALLGLALVVKT